MSKEVFKIVALLAFSLLLIVNSGQLARCDDIHESTVFGPKTYLRGTGDPQIFVDNFWVMNPDGEFRIRVQNGQGGEGKIEDAISSATISINGEEIIHTNDFNQNVAYIDREIATSLISSNNTVEVWLASKPGSFLIVQIFGTDQDSIPPEIEVAYPEDGTTIDTDVPNIEVSYSDDWLGVDTSTFHLRIDGEDFSDKFIKGTDQASYQLAPEEALAGGDHTIITSIEDVLGNFSADTCNFAVAMLRAIAEAVPTSGPAPLVVLFKQAGEDPSGTIEVYRWDFQGDGTWDTYDQVARNYTYTYNLSGTYHAVLQVTNNRGETAVDTAVITVTPTPPTAAATSHPSNGPVPLSVSFQGSGTDPDGYITLYEWDFDGDGTYDWSSSSSGNTSHTYEDAGTFSAIFRVTDNDGLTDTAPPILTEVRVGPPGSPTADGTANPSSGDAPLTVNFTGVGTDPEGNIVLYEWDFDGDGTYDWSSTSTGNTSHTYTLPGTYYPAFRVTDGDGLTGVDYVDVSVGLGINLVIPDDTFDPYQGETAIIRTTLSAPIPMNLLIKTKEGILVRTLVANETRPAGTHDDVWDGTDDNGGIANDGPYYAVLEYFLEGEWLSHDLTHSTGGYRYLPTRQSTGGSEGNPRMLYPFEDELLDIHFSTKQLYTNIDRGASEITCFVGYLWNVNMRIRTIVERMPFPAGSHVIWWDGLDDEGNIAEYPPGYYLILGFWGYTLPDNAVFLTGGKPVVSNVSADPNYFSGFSEKCGYSGESGIQVSFDLSELSTVYLRVYNLKTGTLVRTVTEANLPAGTHDMLWDGKNNQDFYVDSGDYEIGIVAQDTDGNESMVKYALVRFIH